MNINYDKNIKEWITKNRQEVIDNWIEISKTPAIKSEPCEGAPFGKECQKALLECTNLFKNRGFNTEVFDKGGYSLVSFGEGEKTIGLFTHSDVVPTGEGWIYTDPFCPIVKDGALIGRGVEDNKSGIMASLCAMEIIREYNIPLKSRLQLFIGSNEETGMEDIAAFKKEHKMPDASLIPDAEFPVSTGEKGICQFFAKSDGELSNIIEFHGGEAFNVVLDKVTAKIKSTDELKEEVLKKVAISERIEAEEKEDLLIITAKGIAKHASIPEGSLNAAQVLAEFLKNIEALPESDRQIMAAVDKILSCPFGTSLGIQFCDDLFGKLTIVNGMARVEDKRLLLSFDMRYSSALGDEDLIKDTQKAFKDFGFDIMIEDHKPGFSIDQSSKIPQIFEDIYREVTGFDKKSFKLGGGTYARYIKNAFSVGTFSETKDQTKAPLKMPDGHGGAHQCDEMIDIESFFTAVRIIIHYLIAMDEEINK